jgi:hypothetical protein
LYSRSDTGLPRLNGEPSTGMLWFNRRTDIS